MRVSQTSHARRPRGRQKPSVDPEGPWHCRQPAPPDVRVQDLEAALAKKTQEYDATREQLLRLMADFDNYRKRMTRQHEEARQFAMADLVIALLTRASTTLRGP